MRDSDRAMMGKLRRMEIMADCKVCSMLNIDRVGVSKRGGGRWWLHRICTAARCASIKHALGGKDDIVNEFESKVGRRFDMTICKEGLRTCAMY